MIATPPISSQNTAFQYLPPDGAAGSPNQSLMPLTARVNDRDHLEVGGCDVVELLEKFDSPLYIVDEATLRAGCRQYRDAFREFYGGESQVLYASKAWSNLAICAIAHGEGLGIDVVSGGEIHTALQAGVCPSKIYFHGNNKSRQELELAVTHGLTVVVDNWLDLETLVAIAADSPTRVMVRLTPGIECHTHEYIQTGHLDSKFGFDPNEVDAVFAFLAQHRDRLTCTGLHAHIGSQIFELQPHGDLPGVLVQWLVKARSAGLPVDELNVGGGLGIRYTESDDPPTIREWAKTIADAITAACAAQGVIPLPKLLCEPGRSLIGPTTITAYRVGSTKTVPDIRTYLAVDGGMSDNPRPITYQSLYRVVTANRMSAPCDRTVTVAGKHCESGDVLIKDAQLPELSTGDILAVPATGAYNASMASNYNRVPRPAAVLVSDGEANLIQRRETYSDLLRFDCLPDRLKG
ncbi:MAG: diaminopimelate decarboxylase [Cyanobacteria bacterium]|nr:diaminopimelate decarboxylase [Cyanobacteriota bacterium]